MHQSVLARLSPHDRVMLDTKTGSRCQGGGFGPTVQLDEGKLATSYSYRGEDGKSHREVVRWELRKSQLTVANRRSVAREAGVCRK